MNAQNSQYSGNISMTIGGEHVAGQGGFDVTNPATGGVVAACPAADQATLNVAVAAAAEAFESWSRVPDEERAAAVKRMADAIESHAGELARLLTLEQGKPLKGLGSEFELGGCIGWTRATAGLSLPVEVIEETEQGRIEKHYKPLGVVGSITPWNWPLMIAVWHVMPAVRSGNTVVIKPSPYTPLSTLKLMEIVSREVPAGVINAIAGPDELGQWMTEHTGIQKIIFTGSCETGKKVMRSASVNLKRLTLELGGNDAGIVLPDVKPEAIAERLFWGAFLNNGQTCAALKRLYVHESVYDQTCEALASFAANVPMGDGLDERNLLGPIQNRMQYDKVTSLVESAKQAGGRVLCGGEAPGGDGYFYPITLIADLSDGVSLVDEEQFGPALPIIRYSSVEDAIARANASENGLGGSIWSTDIDRAKKLAERLECGTAWINKHGDIAPHVPFGGVKASGFGVEFGREGLEEYTSIQVLNIANA